MCVSVNVKPQLFQSSVSDSKVFSDIQIYNSATSIRTAQVLSSKRCIRPPENLSSLHLSSEKKDLLLPTTTAKIDRPLPPKTWEENGAQIKTLMLLDILGVDIKKSMKKNPSLSKFTSMDRIYEVLDFLQDMGLEYNDFARIFAICPEIMTSSVHDNLRPVLNFLLQEVKLPEKQIRKVIKKWPKLLSLSVKHRLRPTLQYLQDIGYPCRTFFVCSNAVLLTLSVQDHLAPKLKFLQSLGMSYTQAVSMVIRAPATFTYSISNNMQPKYEYLLQDMGKSLGDLMQFPQYLSFSLENRIKLRHRLMIRHNVSLSLPDMLKSTDQQFQSRLRQTG